MLFMKSGTLREVLGLARDERMVDGQDPLVVMNGCTEVCMNAPVLVEIEVCGGGKQDAMAETTKQNGTTVAVVPQMQEWPTLLKMYVSVQSPPFGRNEKRATYLFARRYRPEEQGLSHLLAQLSKKRLNFVMNVR